LKSKSFISYLSSSKMPQPVPGPSQTSANSNSKAEPVTFDFSKNESY
jgi:hypothetical protein